MSGFSEFGGGLPMESFQSAGVKGMVTGGAIVAGTRQGVCASRHMAAEQRRRARINDRLDALRQLVPHSERANTAVFLSEVYDYIQHLHRQLEQVGCRVPDAKVSPVGPAPGRDQLMSNQASARPRAKRARESEDSGSDNTASTTADIRPVLDIYTGAVLGNVDKRSSDLPPVAFGLGPQEAPRPLFAVTMDPDGYRGNFGGASQVKTETECDTSLSLSLGSQPSQSRQPSQPGVSSLYRVPAPPSAVPVLPETSLSLKPPHSLPSHEVIAGMQAGHSLLSFDSSTSVSTYLETPALSIGTPDHGSTTRPTSRASSVLVDVGGTGLSRGGQGNVLHRPVAIKPHR